MVVTSADKQWGVPSSEVLSLVEDYLSGVSVQAHERLGDVLGVAVTTAVAGGEPVTTGASTDLAAEIDLTQYAIGVGPCLHALQGGGEQYVPDLARDGRWGRYGPAAAAQGALSSLSVPVTDDGSRILGVLKVYAGRTDGLDPDQQTTARQFAHAVAGGLGLASALVSTSYELEDRIEAMDHRRTIDLATGVLMARLGLGPDAAFDALREQSQNTNVKLRDVAAAVLASLGQDGATGPAVDGERDGSLIASTIQAPFSRRGEAPVPGR